MARAATRFCCFRDFATTDQVPEIAAEGSMFFGDSEKAALLCIPSISRLLSGILRTQHG